MNYTKFIVLLATFLDVLGIGIIIPSLPGLQAHFGVNEFLISLSVTSYAAASFLAGPVLGQLGDRYGRKPIFLICVRGSVLSWFTIALSPTYWIFILGRVINGITGGNIAIIQSILSDISKDSKERKANLGLFGAIFGSAFIIGPLVGGLMIHSFGDMGPFWLAGILSLVEVFLIYFKMDETNKEKHERKISFNPFGILLKGLMNKDINKYLYSYMFLILGMITFQSTMTLYLNDVYGVPGYATGYILAGIGAIQILNQMFLMKNFWMRFFSDRKLLIIINLVSLIGYLSLVFIKGFYPFIVIIFGLFFVLSLANPIYQGEVLEHTSPRMKGEILGVFGSIMALNMGIGSMLGGYLLSQDMNIFIYSASFILISLIIVINILSSQKINKEISI